eukprot:scaffold114395_cov35-Attheya_sp.AAC.1
MMIKPSYGQLSYEAQLNMQADQLATQAWQTYFCDHPHVHYPDSRCTLYINNAAVNIAYRSYMRWAYSSHDAREYLMDKYKWDVETCEGIDWYSHGTALTSLPHNQQRFVHRFIIDWLPINNRLHERGRIPSATYALCATKTQKLNGTTFTVLRTNTPERNSMNPYAKCLTNTTWTLTCGNCFTKV